MEILQGLYVLGGKTLDFFFYLSIKTYTYELDNFPL